MIFNPHCPKKQWKAYGRKNGWYYTIGYFATKEEAAARYNEWALKTHGPDAYLNPVS